MTDVSPGIPMLADDGTTVIRSGGASTTPIRVYGSTLNQIVELASSPAFTAIGRNPSISDDGSVIAFAGNRGDGPGLFISCRSGSSFQTPIRIAGENGNNPLLTASPELGGNGAAPIYFESFDLDSRIGVYSDTTRATGARDNTVIVTFVATPSAASPSNNPVAFTSGRGIWTIRVYRAPDVTVQRATPVIQIGDLIDGVSVTDLSIHDPIAGVLLPTTPPITRHHVAFWAMTSNGPRVALAVEKPLASLAVAFSKYKQGADPWRHEKIWPSVPS